MKRYIHRCDCGHTQESTDPVPPRCDECGRPMRRDWRGESVGVAYHPSKTR